MQTFTGPEARLSIDLKARDPSFSAHATRNPLYGARSRTATPAWLLWTAAGVAARSTISLAELTMRPMVDWASMVLAIGQDPPR